MNTTSTSVSASTLAATSIATEVSSLSSKTMDFQSAATALWDLFHRLTDGLTDGLSTAPEAEKLTSRLAGDLARFWDDSSQISLLLVDDWDPIHLNVTSWIGSQILGLAVQIAVLRIDALRRQPWRCCALEDSSGVRTFRQSDLRKVWGRLGLSSWRVAKKRMQQGRAVSVAGCPMWWIPRE